MTKREKIKRKTGIKQKYISRVCRGERPTAFGYGWKFL